MGLITHGNLRNGYPASIDALIIQLIKMQNHLRSNCMKMRFFRNARSDANSVSLLPTRREVKCDLKTIRFQDDYEIG